MVIFTSNLKTINMNAFTRGIEPKAAMAVGVERCQECHKTILKRNYEFETHICKKCLKKAGVLHFYVEQFSWNRFTLLGKILALNLGLLIAYLVHLLISSNALLNGEEFGVIIMGTNGIYSLYGLMKEDRLTRGAKFFFILLSVSLIIGSVSYFL